MAISVLASGSATMILNTDVYLVSGSSTAGVYQLSVDASNLSGYTELLILLVQQKTISSDAQEQLEDRVVIARGTDNIKRYVDIPRVSQYSLSYKLRQEGGSARVIDWRVDKLE